MFMLLEQVATEVNISVVDQWTKELMPRLVQFGEKILIAGVVFFLGIWIISLLCKLLKRVFIRRKIEGAVASFINSLFNAILKIVLGIVIISILGIPTTSFAAILAAAGLAIGMAMKDNLSNFAGGVMILINKPFKLKDRIVAQGMDGVVKEIGILYTVLITADGRTIYLPNGPLSTGSITNFSTETNRRLDLTYTIYTGNDADEIKQIFTEIVNSKSLALDTPTPFIGITNINNTTFDITIRVWVLNANFGTLTSELNESIYRVLNKKQIIEAPYTIVRKE